MDKLETIRYYKKKNYYYKVVGITYYMFFPWEHKWKWIATSNHFGISLFDRMDEISKAELESDIIKEYYISNPCA